MATSLFFSGLMFIMLRGDVCLMVFRLPKYRKLELGFILMSCALKNTNVWVQTQSTSFLWTFAFKNPQLI